MNQTFKQLYADIRAKYEGKVAGWGTLTNAAFLRRFTSVVEVELCSYLADAIVYEFGREYADSVTAIKIAYHPDAEELHVFLCGETASGYDVCEWLPASEFKARTQAQIVHEFAGANEQEA